MDVRVGLWRKLSLKHWCFWTVVLEKTLESALDCKEIQPVLPKGDQSWVFIGRTDVEAETLILWPPDVKSWLIGKDPDAGKDWGQEGKGTTEDEMVGWYHQLNAHGFGWLPVVGDGTGRPGVLRFMGSQRVGHDWVSELETGWRKRKITIRKGKDYPQTPILKWNKCWNYLTKTYFLHFFGMFSR